MRIGCIQKISNIVGRTKLSYMYMQTVKFENVTELSPNLTTFVNVYEEVSSGNFKASGQEPHLTVRQLLTLCLLEYNGTHSAVRLRPTMTESIFLMNLNVVEVLRGVEGRGLDYQK